MANRLGLSGVRDGGGAGCGYERTAGELCGGGTVLYSVVVVVTGTYRSDKIV